MAFQSRFRETERHGFGERGGRSGDTASGEPSEVRTNAITTRTHRLPLASDIDIRMSPKTSPRL